MHYVLVLDVGTTGVKAFVFDARLNVIRKAYRRFGKSRPKKGRVEQDPMELCRKSVVVMREAVKKSGVPPREIGGWGIAVQRETAVAWDKITGKPLAPALVWEDTRTASSCHTLRAHERFVRERTGLPIIPYFSASKYAWLLRNVRAVRRAHEEHSLYFGTVDSWLMYKLLDGRPHLTDYTNASRTLLFNIKTLAWDEKLCALFGVPRETLPHAAPARGFFGVLRREIAGHPIPLRSVAGDQQASLYAAGEKKGTTKVTYGTGTFVMQATGPRFKTRPGFFTTLAAGGKGERQYALEAKINGTGAEVDVLLKEGASLEAYVRGLARRVDTLVRMLPIRPRALVLDGGILRAPHLAEAQFSVSGVPVRTHTIFDGTALGVAKMVTEEAIENDQLPKHQCFVLSY